MNCWGKRQLCPDEGNWEAGLSSPASRRRCGTHTSQRELSTVTSCLTLGGRGVGPGSLCAAPGLNFTLAGVLRILRKCFANICPQQRCPVTGVICSEVPGELGHRGRAEMSLWKKRTCCD